MKYASGLVTGFIMGVGATCAGLLYLHARGEINLHMLDKTYVRQMYQPRARWIRNHNRPYYTVSDIRKRGGKTYGLCSFCQYWDFDCDESPCDCCRRNTHESHDADCFTPVERLTKPEEPIGTVTSVEKDGDGMRFHIKKNDKRNPDCHDCRYVTRSAEDDPCNHCKRAFDGYPNDYYYKDPRECSSKCVHFDNGMDFVHYCTYCKRNSEAKDGEDFYEEGEDCFSRCYMCKHFEDEADRNPCVDCKHNTDDEGGPENFEYNPDWEDNIE